MRHYAGTVRYNVTNWLEKNKDPLNDTVVSVMKGGANALLLEVWSDYTTQEEAAAAQKAGGMCYKVDFNSNITQFTVIGGL
jgi:myosin protein heavy chain